jgi:hypothetical protein
VMETFTSSQGYQNSQQDEKEYPPAVDLEKTSEYLFHRLFTPSTQPGALYA